MFKPEKGSFYISIAFAAGSIGILFLRFVFDNTHWPASFFAVLCMVGYAVFAKKNQTVDSYDNIGDNCYYLGFLFTLISLAIGLYSFDPNEFQSILKITNNFALAIISTLIGLFLRVLFNQIKNESIDESGELEKVIEKTSTDISTEGKKVSEQLSNLSNSINEIAIDWKNSSVAIKQKFEEMVDDFSSNTSKTLNEHTNSVNTHFEEMQNKFSTTFTSMLEKLKVPIELHGLRLKPQ